MGALSTSWMAIASRVGCGGGSGESGSMAGIDGATLGGCALGGAKPVPASAWLAVARTAVYRDAASSAISISC